MVTRCHGDRLPRRWASQQRRTQPPRKKCRKEEGTKETADTRSQKSVPEGELPRPGMQRASPARRKQRRELQISKLLTREGKRHYPQCKGRDLSVITQQIGG
ncbi:unnamed protein product [Lepidochelys kempii]